ncbi:hypothetical protein BC828DRAFT_382658 [Blastocladiella britannica]|nr:hypothetical protein BC828DRAFT_382658 [Blastocladiella britannica]
MVLAGLKARWTAADWDSLLAYETFHTVKVRDRRLGLLHLVLSGSIAIYIVATILLQQLYLVKEPATGGTVRLTILPPLAPIDPTRPPSYCANATGGCVYLSSSQIMPTTEEAAMFITTRSAISQVVPAARADCNPSEPLAPECMTQFNNATSLDYYSAGVENYTIMVDHTVRGYLTTVSEHSTSLMGVLRDQSGNPIRVYVPYGTAPVAIGNAAKWFTNGDVSKVLVRPPSTPGDVFSVSDLLAAAGVPSLDTSSASISTVGSQSVRHDGMVVVVLIDYANWPTDPSTIYYSYRVSGVTGLSGKRQEVRYIPTYIGQALPALQLWKRSGIRIKFVQTGVLSTFQFVKLLSSLVASVVFFRMSVFVVEFLMIWVMPNRKQLEQSKYERTEIFTDSMLRLRSQASFNSLRGLTTTASVTSGTSSTPPTPPLSPTTAAAAQSRWPLSVFRRRGGGATNPTVIEVTENSDVSLGPPPPLPPADMQLSARSDQRDESGTMHPQRQQQSQSPPPPTLLAPATLHKQWSPSLFATAPRMRSPSPLASMDNHHDMALPPPSLVDANWDEVDDALNSATAAAAGASGPSRSLMSFGRTTLAAAGDSPNSDENKWDEDQALGL